MKDPQGLMDDTEKKSPISAALGRKSDKLAGKVKDQEEEPSEDE